MQTGAQAYQRVAQTTASPRSLEAQLLLKAAGRLQQAIDGAITDPADIDAAVRFNLKVWTVLGPAATDPANPLPLELKNNMGSLAVFIMRHSMSLFAADAIEPERLKVLVNINRQLAAGLRGSANDEPAPAPAPAPAA